MPFHRGSRSQLKEAKAFHLLLQADDKACLEKLSEVAKMTGADVIRHLIREAHAQLQEAK